MERPHPPLEEAFDKLQSLEREHEARQALRQTERQKNLYWIWRLDTTRENIVRHLQSLDQGEKDEKDAIVKQRQLWMESTNSVQLVASEDVCDTVSHGNVEIAEVNKGNTSDSAPTPAPDKACTYENDHGTNITTSTAADPVFWRANQYRVNNTPAYHGLPAKNTLLCATPSRHSRVLTTLANSPIRSLTPQEFRQLPMNQQLLKKYPCIELVDFIFYELSCKLCDANAIATSYPKGMTYFPGRAGVISHLQNTHQKSWQAINEQGLVATRKMPVQEVKSMIWSNHTIPMKASVVSKKRKVP